MTRAERAQQLWSVLALAATNRQILTYAIVEKATGLHRPGIGDCLRPIQQFCIEQKLPALTSIVVSEEDGLPGTGFIAAQDVPAEHVRVFAFRWLDIRAPNDVQLEDAYSRAPDAR
jgi:hypothetical protein